MISISCGSVGLALLALLILILTVSEAARYRLKFLSFIVISAFATMWPLPFMFLRPRNWRNALIPAWQLRQFMKLLGVNYVVRGYENIVKDTGAVILLNHQSGIDLTVLAELWRIIDNCTVVSKKEVLTYSGPFGLAAYLWGTIFIDKARGKDAQDTMNSAAEIVRARRAKLIVFVEGTRHSGSTLREFKKGAFHVAIGAQVPIMPVVVSKYYFINHERKKFDSGTSYITILPPISTDGLGKEDLESLMAKTRQLMNAEFQRSSQEVIRDTGATKID